MFYYQDKSQTINFCTLGGNEALKWLSVIGGIGQSVKLKLNTYFASQNESFKIQENQVNAEYMLNCAL